MRNLLLVIAVVGFLTPPSLGLINIKITADPDPGYGTATVRIWAQGTAAGVFSLAGDVQASTHGPGRLTSTGPMVFSPLFDPTALFTPKPGAAGSNGGWASFGTQQTTWDSPDASLGRADFVQVCHYTVTPAGADGTTLTFVPKSVSGYKALETDKTAVIGMIVSYTFTPEPMTLRLMTLGGMVAIRRRR